MPGFFYAETSVTLAHMAQEIFSHSHLTLVKSTTVPVHFATVLAIIRIVCRCNCQKPD